MNPKLLIIKVDKYINTTDDITLHIYHVLYVYVYEFTGSNLIILDEEEIEKEKYFQMYSYYD